MDLSRTNIHQDVVRTLCDLAVQRYGREGTAAVEAMHAWVDGVVRERGLGEGLAPRTPYWSEGSAPAGMALVPAGMALVEERPRPPYRNERQRRRRKANRKAASAFRAIGERDGYVCRECGATRTLTVEHIIPVFKGGSDDLDNLELLCAGCNEAKGIREHEAEISATAV